MKAYLYSETKSRVEVRVPLVRTGEYVLVASIHGREKTGFSAEFYVPSMKLAVADGGTFVKGCDILANRVGKRIGKKIKRGGARVKVEVNDGEKRVWNWEMDFYVALKDGEIHVDGFTGNAGHLMLVRKMVQKAVGLHQGKWWQFNRRAGH